jgi:hypothetical protein
MKQFLAVILFIISAAIHAQQDSSYFIPKYRKGLMYTVVTRVGTKYTGFLRDETKDYVVIEDKKDGQTHELRKDQIVSMRAESDSHVYKSLLSEYYFADNYMFSGSSIMYDKPDISLRYHWFFLDNINVKINRHWDISVNSIAIYPTSLGFKYACEIAPDTYFGFTGSLVGNVSHYYVSNYILGYYGAARISSGNPNRHFSISAGLLGVNNELLGMQTKDQFVNIPFGSIAVSERMGEKWTLCGEGFYFPQVQAGFAGAGVKFTHDRHTAWTFGCYTYVSLLNNQFSPGQKVVPIPYIGYASNIYRR